MEMVLVEPGLVWHYGRIDWRLKAVETIRLINAINKPFSGAFCYFQGQKFTIWDAELVEEMEIFLAIPGQVTKSDNNYVEVACGEGKLRILSVQYDDKLSLPSKYLTSVRMRLTWLNVK